MLFIVYLLFKVARLHELVFSALVIAGSKKLTILMGCYSSSL